MKLQVVVNAMSRSKPTTFLVSLKAIQAAIAQIGCDHAGGAASDHPWALRVSMKRRLTFSVVGAVLPSPSETPDEERQMVPTRARMFSRV